MAVNSCGQEYAEVHTLLSTSLAAMNSDSAVLLATMVRRLLLQLRMLPTAKQFCAKQCDQHE
eukprot:4294828-Amphidinium_carterae.1